MGQGKWMRWSVGCLFSALATLVQADDSLDAAYRKAVADAAFASADEISSDLLAVDERNPNLVWDADRSRILVTTWKANGAYERFLMPYRHTSENADYAVWVTAVPQIRQFCRQFLQSHPNAGPEDVALRLKQYLGLNHTWSYDVFVEMWVNPADLFRPCVDPQTDDSTCDLQFGSETPQVAQIADYPAFYRDLYFKSFRSSAGVPWTGLGYTYDWGNPVAKVGASEFILRPGTPYEIKQVVPTFQYCRS